MPNRATVECRYLTDRHLRLFTHKRGFTAFALDPGSQWVLVLDREERVENTSIRMALELVLALRTAPPLRQPLAADSWVETALYKQGGPDLQFESRSVSGTLELSEVLPGGVCHGKLHLLFADPAIDKTGAGRVVLDTDF